MKSLCAGNFCFFCFLFTCFYFVSYFLFFLCFLCCQIFSLKNWNYLDSLIYYTTDMYPSQKPYGEFFSTHLVSIFYHTYIFLFLFSFIFYLPEPILICQNLFLFDRTYFHLCAFDFICENLSWLSMRISSFYNHLWKSIFWVFMKTSKHIYTII